MCHPVSGTMGRRLHDPGQHAHTLEDVKHAFLNYTNLTGHEVCTVLCNPPLALAQSRNAVKAGLWTRVLGSRSSDLFN